MMTASALRVRESTEADIEAVTAVYAHHVLTGLATFELDPPQAQEMAGRRAAIVDAGLPYLVGEVDGRVVGYAYAGPYRPRPAYRFTVEDSIYIAPEWQRRGLGSRLLAELIQRCEERGCRQMIAVIGDSNNQGSIGLHSMHGFRMVGVFESAGFKFGRWVDTVLMQRPLGSGSGSLPLEPAL